MLKGKKRNNCLYSLVRQYIDEQQQNIVYQRESSSGYTLAKGKLVGFCTAYQYEIFETTTFVEIVSRTGRFIMRLTK